MLADARKAGVSVILLSNHYRPPTDFITDTWRGLHEGVLFIPGSEERGFLIHPVRSVIAHLQDPTPSFIETVRADGGLIFLSHIEDRPDHSTAGLTGMEIYNRHADARKDTGGLLAIALKLTHPTSLKELKESMRLFPDEVLASQVEYPADYLAKWDADTKTRRLTGVAANDCHHNMILMVKMVDPETVLIGTNVDRDDQMRKFTATLRPGIRAFTKGHSRGDVLGSIDLDPYYRSFQNVSTHVFARVLTEAAIRAASARWARVCESRLDVRSVGVCVWADRDGAGGGRSDAAIAGDDGRRGEVCPGPEVDRAIPGQLSHPHALLGENHQRKRRREPGSHGRLAGCLPRRGLARRRGGKAPMALFQSDLCAMRVIETLAIRP